MDDDTLTTMEENFDAIPEEVRGYIFSSEFNDSFESLCSEIAITGEEKDLLKGSLFGFLSHNISEEELDAQISRSAVDQEKIKKVKSWISVNVSQKILDLLTDAYIKDEEENPTTVEVAPLGDSSPSLTSLTDRLKKTTVAAPVQKRETALDPYHEPIDN
jgi:hypothetical protein